MIHRYINNGYHIVLDVNSGSVHVVDELAYDVIPIVEKLLAQKVEGKEQIVEAAAQQLSRKYSEVEETVEEIFSLKEEGVLFTEDIYEKIGRAHV